MDRRDHTESLIEHLRQGDRSALAKLFQSHRDYLKHVIQLRINDDLRVRLDPSDVVQETQVEALKQLHEYASNPNLPVRLWLRQIALDRLGMAHRRHLGARKRSVYRELALPEHSSYSIAQRLVAGIASPSRIASRQEIARKVRESVARLNEADREIIMLLAFEGLDSTESAQVLGIEPATARKRYGRALLKLRQLLLESGLGSVGE